MQSLSAVLIVVGLVVFETFSSIDNAIINAEVLSTMGKRAKRLFMTWGIFFAVFVVRGILPWCIVWASTPSLGFIGSFTALFSSDLRVHRAVEASAPILLMGGGVFLLFLFLHWLFLEAKEYSFRFEAYVARQSIWFYAVVSIVLMGIVWNVIRESPLVALGAVTGSTLFFVTHGFRLLAEEEERLLKSSRRSDWSKMLFLEVIDLSFSIDGVIGAFAFTLAVPLILIGNGIGAIVVRQLTLANIERMKQYVLLENGAMYSICVLGSVMVVEGFGVRVPEYISPVATLLIIGYFFERSRRCREKGVVCCTN